MNEDVVIVGGGVIGTAIARELSRYKLNIILVEKEDRVNLKSSVKLSYHQFLLSVDSIF